MQQVIEDLRELQKIDLDVHRIDTQLKEIPGKAAELKSQLDRIHGIIDRERKQLADDEGWLKELESEVAMQNELMTKSRGKLSGARNEREMNAAQREIDMIKGAIGMREKEMLRLLEAIETLRRSVGTKEEQFRELEEGLRAKQEEADRQVAVLQAERETYAGQRASLEARIPVDVRAMYDRIRRRRPQAMVEVISGTCQGCHLQIPPQTYNELQVGARILQCPNCTRIIYYRRPEERAGAESGSS